MTKHLEREPFEQLVKSKNLVAFKHNDFWQCMDTIRDKEILEEKIKKYKFERNIIIFGAQGYRISFDKATLKEILIY